MNEDRLSIQLRRDGLSFAYGTGTHPVSGGIPRPREGFEAVFCDPRWPRQEFGQVWVCVPTEAAVLIPAEFDRPETYKKIFEALGYADDPESHILAHPAGEKILLHGVCEAVFQPLTEKYGEKTTFSHPLITSLGQPPEDGTVLHVDVTAGTANYTLHRDDKLLYADVLPLADDVSLLLAVNRIVVTHKLGAVRIVCSGERCMNHSVLLGLHYRDVSVHADRENRDLFFPLR